MSTTSTNKPSPFMRGLIGLLLLLPAFGLCTVDQLWLTISTFTNSLTDSKLGRDGEYIGFTNYGILFTEHPSVDSLGYTLLLITVRVLMAAILPLLLALAINNFGKTWNRAARLWFTLPLAYFGPALMMFGPAFVREVWDPNSIHRTYLLIDGIATLAVACGMGLIVYLAVLRGRNEGEKLPVAPLVTTWLVTQLAVAAYALQSFNSLSFIALGSDGHFALGQLLLQSIRFGNLGMASSISMFIFLLTALLGIAATFLLLTGKLQLSFKTDAASSPAPSGFFIPGMIALLIGALAALFVTIIPLGMSIARSVGALSEADLSFMSQSSANSILPMLVTILFIQLPVAYLGALGISVVKPFGKASEWILLLFSPWLFVTAMPFALAAFQNLHTADLLDSPFALTPPILFSIPMLFILTLFFKGQFHTWETSGNEGTPTLSEVFKHWLLPSLPLALFMSALSMLVATQEVFASFMVGASQAHSTITTVIAQFAGGFNPSGIPAVIAWFGVPVAIIAFAIFATLQITYLQRLAILRK